MSSEESVSRMRSASASAESAGRRPRPGAPRRRRRRGVDLGARDHPRRAVLVPDPDVLHPQMEERVARLRHVLEVELVAEVRRVLREHAVAEEAEDGRVLLLQPELGVGLEFVEFVEVGHRADSRFPRKLSSGPSPGTARPGSRSASGSSTNRRSWSRGCGTVSPGSSSARRRRGGGRGRSSAARSGPVARAAELALDREQRVEELAGVEVGLDRGRGVEEARLVEIADGLGLAEDETATTRTPGERRAPRARRASSPRGRRGSRRARCTPAALTRR